MSIKFSKKIIITFFVSILAPLLVSFIFCATKHASLSDIFFPSSGWNDELIYYKQVEAVANHGAPIGYYGYNESHAEVGTFSTWGPVSIIPWMIYGKIFGWNYSSPIIANFIFMSIALFLFLYWAKLSKEQIVFFLLMYASFYPFTRYLFSSMPEVFSYASALIVFAACIHMTDHFKLYKAVLLSLFILFLTLSRPYMLLLMLYLLIPTYKNLGIKKSIIIVCMMPLLAIAYLIYSAKMCAPYITQSMDLSWAWVFKYNSLLSSAKYILMMCLERFQNIIVAFFSGYRDGTPVEAFCAAFMSLSVLVFVATFFQKDKCIRLFSLLTTLCNIGILGAVLLFYPNLQQAAKHFIPFIALDICVLTTQKWKSHLPQVLTIVSSIILFCIHPVSQTHFNINLPLKDDKVVNSITEGQSDFNTLAQYIAKDKAKDKDKCKYNNTILILFDDIVDGTTVQSNIVPLYTLPSELSINICTYDYVCKNINELYSKFAYVIPGGNIDKLLQSSNLNELIRSSDYVVYLLRD